jgi:hypothetical protein
MRSMLRSVDRVLAFQPLSHDRTLKPVFRVTKTSHTAFTFMRRLMAVLGSVVPPSSRLDEHMLDVGQLEDLRLGGRIAAQLVDDDLARHWTRT